MVDSGMKRFPIPVVRLIVENKQGKVLLLRRQMESHGAGGWCLPGGKVDYGQAVEEAVKRELAEETSLVCTGVRFLFYQDSPPMHPGGMHCINLYFACKVRGKIALNDESIDHIWIAREDMNRYSIVFGNEEGLRRYWDSKNSRDSK